MDALLRANFEGTKGKSQCKCWAFELPAFRITTKVLAMGKEQVEIPHTWPEGFAPLIFNLKLLLLNIYTFVG